MPYHTELATYLASRNHGAQLEQIADAFDIGTATAAARLKDLRAWLGTNPRTGQPHLPHARKSQTSQQRGINTYKIEDLLIDADLFRQLHLRGQARGGLAGIADLEVALDLVTGEPYAQRRPGGYTWLRDNPFDEYLTVGIEKVAHTIATWSLEQGQPDRAEHAAHIALLANPYAEMARLDLAAALQAQGSLDAAERLLSDEVYNRDDDDNGPGDPPDRTQLITRAHKPISA